MSFPSPADQQHCVNGSIKQTEGMWNQRGCGSNDKADKLEGGGGGGGGGGGIPTLDSWNLSDSWLPTFSQGQDIRGCDSFTLLADFTEEEKEYGMKKKEEMHQNNKMKRRKKN